MKVLEAELAARRDMVARTPVLSQLAGRLRHNLECLLDDPVYLPDAKALLSRDGGVCPSDGARLDFHPMQPHLHRCPRCGGEFTGERHHRAWVTRYQIWLSERAVQLALLGGLTGQAALSHRAGAILSAYAERYRSYPNRDNVLGPTRLFFSTYLESIWLVQIAIAVMLLEASSPDALPASGWRAVRDMVEESVGLISQFDEGRSNRQVWNDAAMLSAGMALDRTELIDHAILGPSGLEALLAAVGHDGLWWEGENYHLFALRGFLLAGELARWSGRDHVYASGALAAMFTAPLATLLPDLTLPARGDAPFGVSVRQPRFAELWELGRARAPDPRLDAILVALYGPDAPEAADGGLCEIAEQEQNRTAHRQHRDRLGWKSLLWMLPDAPATAEPWAEPAVLLEEQGVAVLRSDQGAYLSIECGRPGGGHRHPDVLHLSLHARGRPVLADFGTGSYVSSSLHYYRSALAHNLPLLAGVGLQAVSGWCQAFDASDRWLWCRAMADDPFGADTAARRTVIVGPDCVIDIVDVRAPGQVTVDLPIHPLATLELPVIAARGEVAHRADGGHQTGYDAARVIGELEEWSAPIELAAASESLCAMHLAPRPEESVLLMEGPGPPGSDFADGDPLPFLVRRASGSGRWITAFADRDARIAVSGEDIVLHEGVTTTSLRLVDSGVEIRRDAGEVLALGGLRRAPSVPGPAPPKAPTVFSIPRIGTVPTLEHEPPGMLEFELDGRHYRRSEGPYGGEGPRAQVRMAVHDDSVVFLVDVQKVDPVFRLATASDPALDNETADIHSDGVQCYVGRDQWEGYLVIPGLESGGVRSCPVRGTAAETARLDGRAEVRQDGYRVALRVRSGRPYQVGDRFRFNVVVNEMRRGRERRAGQLALTGGGWVYLRGDRESPEAALVAEVM